MKTDIKMAKNQVPFPVFTVAREETFDMPLKIRNPNLYYGNSYMEYYYFYM